MATSCHRLFHCNNTTKEDNGTLPSFSSSLQHHHKRRQWHITVVFFFSNTKKTKHIRKQQKKNQEKGGSLPSSSHFALSLLAPAFTLLFQMLSPASFLSQAKKKKKTIEKKKNAEKGRNFLSSSHFAFSFLAPTFAVPFLPFYFKHFFLASFFAQAKEKKKVQRREGAFLQALAMPSHFWLPLCPLTFGSRFCPLTFPLLFQKLYPNIFFFSSRKKERKTKKKNIEKEKNAKKGRSLLSSSRFALSLLAPAFGLLLVLSFWTFSPWHLLLFK